MGRIGAAGQSVLRRGADSLRIGIGSIRKKEVNAMTCDEALYRQYLSGDDEGLNALMKKYGDPMTLYIDGYLHDVHESEELMLDVFAYLFTKKPRIRPGGWLMFEVGEDQADAVMALMKDAKYTDVTALEDTAGIRRVVVGRI